MSIKMSLQRAISPYYCRTDDENSNASFLSHQIRRILEQPNTPIISVPQTTVYPDTTETTEQRSQTHSRQTPVHAPLLSQTDAVTQDNALINLSSSGYGLADSNQQSVSLELRTANPFITFIPDVQKRVIQVIKRSFRYMNSIDIPMSIFFAAFVYKGELQCFLSDSNSICAVEFFKLSEFTITLDLNG